MQPIKTFISVTLLTVGVGGSSYFLFRLRSETWLPGPGEILSARPEEAIYGAVWLLSVSATLWVAFTTVVSVSAYATRLPMAIRAVEWITLPPIRRLARRSAALLLAAASLSTAPVAGATELPPIPLTVGIDQPVGSTSPAIEVADETPSGIATPVPLRAAEDTSDHPKETDSHKTPTDTAVPVPLRVDQDTVDHSKGTDSRETPTRTAVPVPLQTGQDTVDRPAGTVSYTVRPGDDMWSITVAYLTRQQNGPPSVVRIIEVWQEVVDLNRNRISSGNPDLIFPGEKLLLPR